MADLIALPERATSDVFALVTDATAYFFAAGTSTPLTVYTDSGLGTPRGTSVAADAEGVFPQCWVAGGTAVKVDIQDGSAVSLPGFPQDNFPRFSEGGQDAADIVFAPITGNPATDAQTAIANNTADILLEENSRTMVATGGSSNAYTLTPGNTISAYATGQTFTVRWNHTNTGAATLNVNSVGTVNIKKRDLADTVVDVAAGDLATGKIDRVQYDGTQFILLTPGLAAEGSVGIVEAASTAEMTAGAAGKYPDAAKVAAFVGDQVGSQGAAVSISGASPWNLSTAIDSGANWIEVGFRQVSLSGTDDVLVQLSTGGAFTTSGYASETGNLTGTGQSVQSDTTGFIVNLGAAANSMSGTLRLIREPSSNTWVASHANRSATNTVAAGGGDIAMAGEVDGVRVTTNGSDTGDAGVAWVRWGV